MAESTAPLREKNGVNGGFVVSRRGLVAIGGQANGGNPISSSVAAKCGKGLKHNPGVSVEWTPEELEILEEGLTTFADFSIAIRYAKISSKLQSKTVRDVAMKVRFMAKKDCRKKRKEDHNHPRKNQEKRDTIADSWTKPATHLAAGPVVPPNSSPMLTFENDDELLSKEIGGPTGQLLEHNFQILNQIALNLTVQKVHENIDLFCQVRDNIVAIMNDSSDMPEIMKQMPPLPVQLNETLASSILSRSPLPPAQ